MKRRGLFAALASLAAAPAALAAMPRPRLDWDPVEDGALSQPPLRESDAPPDVLEAQHRRRRCRWETHRVRYRDRWGRMRWRTVRREVCW
jgi:hypothetical protein